MVKTFIQMYLIIITLVKKKKIYLEILKIQKIIKKKLNHISNYLFQLNINLKINGI